MQRPNLHKTRCGSVLLLAVIMIIVISCIGLGLLRLGLGARLQQIRTSAQIAAQTAADAGVTQAVYLMRAKLASEAVWDNTSLPSMTDVALPACNSSFSFVITGDPSSGFTITSTGFSGNIQKTINCKLDVKSSWFGIGVDQTINVKHNALLGTIPADETLTIRTNSVESGAIEFKSGITIPGGVIVGPGGDPETVINAKKDVVIEGQTYAASEEIKFPAVTVPADLQTLPTVSYSYKDGVSLTGNLKYSSLSLPSKSVQDVVGDCRIYVTGKTTLNNKSELAVKSNGSLTLYLNGDMEDKNSSGITNETSTASKLKVYGTNNCKNMTLKAKSTLRGAVYAPDAALVLDNSSNFYGAFVGKSFETKNSGGFYFDTSLKDVLVDDPQAYLAVNRWWE